MAIPYAFDKILYLDIETVPQTDSYNNLDENFSQLWEYKAQLLKKDDTLSAAQLYDTQAGIYAEFGKIVCISVGVMRIDSEQNTSIYTRSFANDDEKILLEEFSISLNKFFQDGGLNICGHNIKEFDIPYICRRMLINNLRLPVALQIAGKKPWEIPFIDTLELWKFGDYKNYTSLKLLCAIFHIPTPKDDIDGSQVADVYYREHNLSRIATYCEKDVVATAQLLRRLCGLEIIPPENIFSKTK